MANAEDVIMDTDKVIVFRLNLLALFTFYTEATVEVFYTELLLIIKHKTKGIYVKAVIKGLKKAKEITASPKIYTLTRHHIYKL